MENLSPLSLKIHLEYPYLLRIPKSGNKVLNIPSTLYFIFCRQCRLNKPFKTVPHVCSGVAYTYKIRRKKNHVKVSFSQKENRNKQN